MKSFKVVKLEFSSPLHIGKGLPDDYANTETVYHSDSLKAALFVMGIKLDSSIGLTKENAIDFHNSFKISSCFPYYHDEFFLPRPVSLNVIEIQGEKEAMARKLQKKIAYLSKSLFEQFANVFVFSQRCNV